MAEVNVNLPYGYGSDSQQSNISEGSDKFDILSDFLSDGAQEGGNDTHGRNYEQNQQNQHNQQPSQSTLYQPYTSQSQPSYTSQPDPSSRLLEGIDRLVEDSVRRNTSSRRRTTDVKEEKEVNPFDGLDLTITPEDEKIIGDPKIRRTMEKLVNTTLKNYHDSFVSPTQKKLLEQQRAWSERERELQDRLNITGLSVSVPDMHELMSDPDYVAFAREPVFVPNSPTPIPRSDALSLAMQNNNFAWINSEFDKLRQVRRNRQGGQQVNNQSPVSTQQYNRQQHQPNQTRQQQNVNLAIPSSPNGSPGVSYPPPGMGDLRPATFSRAKIERQIMELSAEIQRNPSDNEKINRYSKLRAAYEEASKAGRLV